MKQANKQHCSDAGGQSKTSFTQWATPGTLCFSVRFLLTLPLGLWLDHNSTVPGNPIEIKKLSLHHLLDSVP